MSTFDKIIDAIDDGNGDKILQFMGFEGFKIVKVIGRGQQGVVLKLENRIGKHFALKMYHPSDTDVNLIKDGPKRFFSEIKCLTQLHHKNIVKIFTGGIAKWDDDALKWQINEGISEDYSDITIEKTDILFYIMDYIEGDDISSIFPELRDDSDSQEEMDSLHISERLKLFEELTIQVSKAISYFHEKGIKHRDIKAKNIIYRKDDSTFLVVDFGFAKDKYSASSSASFPKKEHFDAAAATAGDYFKFDIGQFAMMLSLVLPSLEKLYGNYKYEGLRKAITKALDPFLGKRFNSIKEFSKALKQHFLFNPGWIFQRKLGGYLTSDLFGKFDSKMRIPVSGSILLSKEVTKIIDTPQFQKLRGIRQLGPAIFVFPGANHTRFEHSLGTYALSLRYIEKLMRIPAFRVLCDPVDETIKLIVLSALLHDIGHYPYSHWIEEIDELPGIEKLDSHEKRAEKILSSGEIKNAIEEWGVNIKDICDIIQKKHLRTKSHIFINSIINSLIDVDKIDYLIRDSVHCGVNYGRGIDLERLLDSIYIHENELCITDKGCSSLFSILNCRNIMYKEIYWHKTTRACDAMFKRFYYEHISNMEDKHKVYNYLELPDDYFIQKLYEETQGNKALNQLIKPFAYKGRELYKPAYIYYESNTSNETQDTQSFFDKILQIGSYQELIKIGDRLQEKLKSTIPDIKPLDIIVERTGTGKKDRILKNLRVYNVRKNSCESPPDELRTLEKYLNGGRQAYIFCHPLHYEKLKEVFRDKDKRDNILCDI